MSSRFQKREPALRKSRTRWLFMKAHSDSYNIPISTHFRPSRFFMTFDPILRLRPLRPLFFEMMSCCPIRNTQTVSTG